MHALVIGINAQRQGQRLPVLASEALPQATQHMSNEAVDTRATSQAEHRNVYLAAAHAGCGSTGSTRGTNGPWSYRFKILLNNNKILKKFKKTIMDVYMD